MRVLASTLPPFSNTRACCARCGARYEIRVHFDRGCAEVTGEHFHRICNCGHRWLERASERAIDPPKVEARIVSSGDQRR